MDHSKNKPLTIKFLKAKFPDLSGDEIEAVWEDLNATGQDILKEWDQTLGILRTRHPKVSDDNILRIMLNNIEKGY